MNIPETYDYLKRARQDLWATLEGVPDAVLSRSLIGSDRFNCIKALVFRYQFSRFGLRAIASGNQNHADVPRQERKWAWPSSCSE
jgi:hypothetical protein